MNVRSWSELQVGVSAGFDVVITDVMMKRFCETTGDENPLHLDPRYALRHGFRDRVVYGLLTASFYSTLAGVHLPGAGCLLQGLRIDFVAPAYVGDHLRVGGEIVQRVEAYRRLEIVCHVTRAGVDVSRGRIRAGVRPELSTFVA